MWRDDEAKTVGRTPAQVASRENGQGFAGTKGTMPPAILIEASRRVDWRFLLPAPSLGRVVGVAPLAKTLVSSLSLFSDSLTIAETGQSQDLGTDHYELAVACDPSQDTLRAMATWVKEGGHIYVEAHGLIASLLSSGPSGLFRKGRLWRPAAYAGALQEVGFMEVQTHWHWPDFEKCKMMIPLDNHAAVRHALDRGGRTLKGRLRAGVGRWLHWSGLLPSTVPCFSVLARRGGA